MEQSLTSEEAKKYIPMLVNNIVAMNSSFSKAGIGQKSAKSLPFYAGRWVDTVTGNIRLLPIAKSKYVNPLSYNQKLSYLEARVINKWNQYVDS